MNRGTVTAIALVATVSMAGCASGEDTDPLAVDDAVEAEQPELGEPVADAPPPGDGPVDVEQAPPDDPFEGGADPFAGVRDDGPATEFTDVHGDDLVAAMLAGDASRLAAVTHPDSGTPQEFIDETARAVEAAGDSLTGRLESGVFPVDGDVDVRIAFTLDGSEQTAVYRLRFNEEVGRWQILVWPGADGEVQS